MKRRGERREEGRGTRLLLIISAVALLSPHSSLLASSPADSLITAAHAAWADRDQEGRTLAAIALYQQALLADDSQKTLWIDLTRAMGRAVRHASTPKEARQWAERARNAGRQAILENPKRADAHAFYAEALGQYAQTHKGLGSLKRVKEAVRELQEAIRLDPGNAYAHMLLASFYREAPRGFSVGDKKKALEHARKAVEVDPTHAINHLTLAKVLLDHGRKDEAIAALRIIGTLTPPADAIPETKVDQETARRMLKELDHAN